MILRIRGSIRTTPAAGTRFGAFAAAVCILAPLVGTTHIDISRALDRSIPFADNVDAQILFVARLPRVAAGALVGAALAAAGVVFQALLRKTLATPFTLGVSAGASLGAMVVIIFGGAMSVGILSPVPAASLAGAIAASAVVYMLATSLDRWAPIPRPVSSCPAASSPKRARRSKT